MSVLTIIIFVVGIIISVARKNRTPKQSPHESYPPQRQSMPPATSDAQQSAWDWMHSNERDPEGETQMYRDVPEEWIHPVETSVKMDLTEMRESQREIVHATVRESLHVRSAHAGEAAQTTGKSKSKIVLNASNLSQALILSEVLGEPRNKRPWSPRGKR
jgi:hypothetical protein